MQESFDLTIAVHDAKWLEISHDFEEYASKVCYEVLTNQSARLQQHCPDLANKIIGVALVFTDSAEVQKLNKQFRSKDAPTNVLSFAADMEGLQADEQEIILGDVIFAYQVVELEAKQQGKTMQAHVTHLIIHGLLHLLGYDHIIEADAEIMEQIECDILRIFNIQNPYLLEYDINQLHGT